MNNLPMKKMLLAAALIAGALLSIVLYASVYYTLKAGTPASTPDASLADLQLAVKIYPLNEAAFEQEGIVLLSRAVDNLTDFPKAKKDIMAAGVSFRKALRLNPGSAIAHFYYGKTLNLMKYIGELGDDRPFQEFEKAARLAGPNRQLSKEIGLALLGLWGELSAEQKDYAVSILRRSQADQDTAGYQKVLYFWDLNIHDYEVMDKITPDSSVLLRQYALFLGEKSLSSAARHKALSRAEKLDYEHAWKEYEVAQNLEKYGQTAEVVGHLTACLDTLKTIRFFGLLSGEESLGADIEKKVTLWKTASLELGKAKLEDTRNLESAQEALRAYLAVETSYDQITALDTYLKELRVIPETEGELSLKNIPQLSFEVYLMFRLHKYRQIVSLGGQLQRSLLVPDPAVNKYLAEIFELVGDSYLKLDFVYESEAFYLKALELMPHDIEILFRLKRYYERRNDTDGTRSVDLQLTDVLSAGEILSKARTLAKGATFDQPVLTNLSQKRIRLDFQFGILPGNPKPLVAVYLNDRVYWEDYLGEAPLGLEIDANEGVNRLQVTAVNGPVVILKIRVTALASSAAADEGKPLSIAR